MRFEKYEGLGNDFIVVDAAAALGAARARALCDRHRGVGADGVLVVAPGNSPGARATMIVENADGSRPEMCGNGLRCVALYLAQRDGAEVAEYRIDTDAGPRTAQVDRRPELAQVTIDMGRAALLGEHRTRFDGEELAFARVSMGNPHAVRIGEIPPDAIVDRLGPQVSSELPGGANVEIVAPRDGGFDLVVWERGVGRTLACGTGAAATAAVLAVSGRAPFDAPIEIGLPGGALVLWVRSDSLEVRLRGPARQVFSGEVAGTS